MKRKLQYYEHVLRYTGRNVTKDDTSRQHKRVLQARLECNDQEQDHDQDEWRQEQDQARNLTDCKDKRVKSALSVANRRNNVQSH